MLKKSLFIIAMMLVVIGCGNQQKDATVEVEEISLTVTGLSWGSCVSKVRSALAKVTGVTEVITVSQANEKAVVKVEKGKVNTIDLTDAVAAIEEMGGKPRFTASVIASADE